MAAGRVANRFDFGGANYTVDAACGSSLAAAALAVRELESGAADVVILGGADTVQNPFTYLAFSKTQAFSPRGRCRPFDARADGIVISEAVAMLVLKRLADAERDGDRIYAVIKGLGASSDGRAKGLTAPRPEGQVRASRRAYEKAAVSPATVGYVEAHGTGTAAGDLAEVNALTEVFGAAGATRGGCALGSVKSLIGHTKCAAGLAGLINAALALHHQVLPPTIGVESPNPRVDFAASPFRISIETRPWLHSASDHPRRAGVSAFGFGGTNFHAVLEAYDRAPTERASPIRDWPAELLVWRAPDRERLTLELERLDHALTGGARPALRDLAFTLFTSFGTHRSNSLANQRAYSLAIVAHSLDDLSEKLARARRALAEGLAELHDPRGVTFAGGNPAETPRLAFLFPGQGAQHPGMLNELAVLFPEVRRGYEVIDVALLARGRSAISPLVFPPPAFRDEERARQKAALAAPEAAQPALAAACVGLLELLGSFGVTPDLVAGHSFGELVALHAAGAFSVQALAELAESRGRFLQEAVGDDPGAMAALAVGPEGAAEVLEGLEGVLAVNWNGPHQTVISGRRGAVERAVERALSSSASAVRSCRSPAPSIPSSWPGARGPLIDLAARLGVRTPRLPVYSNVNAARYPAGIAEQLGAHLVRPVRFAEMIEAMHADGARVFVEVGPGSALTPLVDSILGDSAPSGTRVRTDGPARALRFPSCPGTTVRRGSSGAARAPDRGTRGTAARPGTIHGGGRAAAPVGLAGERDRARPISGPEPARLGPGPALRVPPVARNGRPDPAPARNGTPAHAGQPLPAIPSPSNDADRVLQGFQETMRTFLDVQRETMLAYLASEPASGLSSDVSNLKSQTSEPSRVVNRSRETTPGATRPEAPAQGEAQGSAAGMTSPARARDARDHGIITPSRSREPRGPTARDRARADGVPRRDAPPRSRPGGRPGDRLHQARRDPREPARRFTRPGFWI